MLKIQIPKPCHEDWNAMTFTQQGAFCGACSKEVVDFTKMTDEEIQHYFINRTSDKTCGRFRSEQIERIRIYLPANLLLQKMASWKKFIAVVMLAFGSMLFSCDIGVQTTTGITKKVENTDAGKPQQSFSDTLQMLGEVAPTMGTPIAIIPDTVSCTNLTGIVEVPSAYVLQGDTVIRPDTVEPPMMGRPVLMGEPAIIDTATKKPASDTSKCKDTGYY